ncbi:trehalose-6-phosphate hydrolase [Citrobacter koseri]|nr:trehalose-6-phosphate hydrolase [Citrobacter koseri]
MAWFHNALNKESPHREFYIWRDGTPDAPPNNWRSKFGGSAWRWHAQSEQYYLHLFAPGAGRPELGKSGGAR